MDSVRWPFDHSADSASVRRAAQRVLALWQAPDLVPDALLVITELAKNVGHHPDDGGELMLPLRGDTLLIEAADSSPGLPRLCPPDPRRIGGRGMVVVAAMSRAW